MKSQGGEVILEVEPHLQVVFGVESQGRDHSEVLGGGVSKSGSYDIIITCMTCKDCAFQRR